MDNSGGFTWRKDLERVEEHWRVPDRNGLEQEQATRDLKFTDRKLMPIHLMSGAMP